MPVLHAWGKVRDQDCLILFDPGSNRNFISQELASKLGIHAHEMGLAIEADRAFDTLAIPVTPLIGKLCLHVQGYVDQEEIIAQVNELVEKGMVCPSSSLLFCSPVLLVQKKDGSYHRCVDYHALNKNTMKNCFPVLRIKDLFDKFQKSSYFSRIDLESLGKSQ